ncbi:MAG: radical SAM protein [Planctomycetes bacterium]|nr:radical SAM protein [Planctomycetota bacterium]
MKNNPLSIPPLKSGGLMLSYRCTSTCKHCVYRCSPRMPDEWITLEMAERILENLAEEPDFGGLHFAGGEATLRMDLLLEIIRLAVKKRVPIEYLETNAGWCRDPLSTREQFLRLRDAGLPCVMISASMYHNEFIPFRNTRTAAEAAAAVFGEGGFFVYPAHLYNLLSRLGGDGRLSLDDFCQELGLSPGSRELHDLFPLIPGGRVPEALACFYAPKPATAFAGQCCESKLTSPHHVHFDLYGNLFTGSCCGISPASVRELHPALDPECHPIFTALCRQGPCGLLELAGRHGFIPDEAGYRGACDLCYRLRRHLHSTGLFAELKPDSFYAESAQTEPKKARGLK